MMKNMKRIVAVLLAGTLGLCNTTSVFAVDTTTVDVNTVCMSQNALFDALDYVEAQKDFLGLEHVDFSGLFIGTPISVYEYLETGIEECGSVYPLLYNGEVVALAQYSRNTGLQISVDVLANKLNDYLDDSISLIYDANGAFVYNGEMLSQYAEFTDQAGTRADIVGDLQLYSSLSNATNTMDSVFHMESDTVSLTEVGEAVPLGYTPSAARTPYYLCDVDLVLQGTDGNICWAACIACIVNYKNGRSYTAAQMARNIAIRLGESGTNYNVSRDWPYYDDYLAYYGLNYSYESSAKPNQLFVVTQIANDNPFITKYVQKDASGNLQNDSHAVVVCGADVMSDYITLMDPDSGFYTVSESNGNYDYIASNNWHLYTGIGYVYAGN